MNCYKHNEVTAIGACKACSKGLCLECSHDSGNGLACKETCIEEVESINEIMERSKQIYSIGSKSTPITSGMFLYFMFALLFGGWGIYQYLIGKNSYEFPILMGVGMFVMGIVVFIKQRKLKLNC